MRAVRLFIVTCRLATATASSLAAAKSCASIPLGFRFGEGHVLRFDEDVEGGRSETADIGWEVTAARSAAGGWTTADIGWVAAAGRAAGGWATADIGWVAADARDGDSTPADIGWEADGVCS